MEDCELIVEHNLNKDLLYWNLAVLPFLHIAHRDIKPDNMMLSPSFTKPVFIDFGLSTFVKEEIGHKSLSYFFGSINFCSD